MIIVNFSTPNYARGQNRLKQSLNGHKMLMLDSYEAIGSPSHGDSPYEFKYHAIMAAFELDDIVVWCDASMWLVGDLSLIENIIKEDGYFFSEAGHWVASWTNSHTKQYFNLTEDEGRVPGGFHMLSAGFIGFDKNSPIAMEFLKQWKASADAGCFRGSHADHRHDQSCASIIARRLNMKYQRGGQHMAYIGSGYSAPEKDVVFYLQGLP